MFIPLWFVVTMLAIGFLGLGVDVYRFFWARRHHDHLIPKTPRAPRG